MVINAMSASNCARIMRSKVPSSFIALPFRDGTVFIHIHRHKTHTKFSIGRYTGVGNMYQRGYPYHHDTEETSRVMYVSTTCIQLAIVGNTHQRGYPSHHDRRERLSTTWSIRPSHVCMSSNRRQRTPEGLPIPS